MKNTGRITREAFRDTLRDLRDAITSVSSAHTPAEAVRECAFLKARLEEARGASMLRPDPELGQRRADLCTEAQAVLDRHIPRVTFGSVFAGLKEEPEALPRFYLDRRPAAIALRDREAGDDPRQFGEHAPGVVIIWAASIVNGEVRLDDRAAVARCESLNAGDRSDIEWARHRIERMAKVRADAERDAARDRHFLATCRWMDATSAAICDYFAAPELKPAEIGRQCHGSEQMVTIDCGPIGSAASGSWASTERLFTIEIGLWTADAIIWRNRRNDIEAAREHVAFAPVLVRILEGLEAVLAEARKTRPVAP